MNDLDKARQVTWALSGIAIAAMVGVGWVLRGGKSIRLSDYVFAASIAFIPLMAAYCMWSQILQPDRWDDPILELDPRKNWPLFQKAAIAFVFVIPFGLWSLKVQLREWRRKELVRQMQMAIAERDRPEAERVLRCFEQEGYAGKS